MDLEKQAYELAGQPFNLGSPKQLQEILFGKLGIKPLKKPLPVCLLQMKMYCRNWRWITHYQRCCWNTVAWPN
jgi:hypothetical protein